MFTITRYFSKVVQPIAGVTNNKLLEETSILRHNLNLIIKSIEQNNISDDNIKIVYDNDKNKSTGILCFKFTNTEENMKYSGQIRFTDLSNSSNNQKNLDEQNLHEYNMALKHAWSN